MTTTVRLIQQEQSRSRAYLRLADAFRLPGPDLGKVVDELGKALAELQSEALDHAIKLFKELQATADTDALKKDYTQLFVGPFLAPAPPYGSVYLEGERRMMGESTVDARHHYLGLGLDLCSDFKEAPDHIAAELEFMQVLVAEALSAIASGDREHLLDSLKRQEIFLRNHLGAWMPAFAAKVTEHANTPFYRHLALAARQFISEEIEALPDLGVFDEAEAGQVS